MCATASVYINNPGLCGCGLYNESTENKGLEEFKPKEDKLKKLCDSIAWASMCHQNSRKHTDTH